MITFILFLFRHLKKTSRHKLTYKIPSEGIQNDGCKWTSVTCSGGGRCTYKLVSGWLVPCRRSFFGFVLFISFFNCCELLGSSVLIQKVSKTSPRTAVSASTLVVLERSKWFSLVKPNSPLKKKLKKKIPAYAAISNPWRMFSSRDSTYPTLITEKQSFLKKVYFFKKTIYYILYILYLKNIYTYMFTYLYCGSFLALSFKFKLVLCC